MKYVKILVLMICLLLVAACGNNQAKEKAEQMKLLDDNMTNLVSTIRNTQPFSDATYKIDNNKGILTVYVTKKWLQLPQHLKLETIQTLNKGFIIALKPVLEQYRPKAYGIYLNMVDIGKVAQYESFNDKTEIYH
jgi:outer membrane lipoprotein-sorting protein